MFPEKILSETIPENFCIRLVEPHIYTIYSQVDNIAPYDKFGGVYEVVACNRLYNRLVWGYWTSAYHTLCLEALRSSQEGWILDAGCGSLAFTAKAYIECFGRPTVLLDQSMRLLRSAKARLIRLHGSVPSNMVFLHGDALELPFEPKSFNTIISMNLLHVLHDVKRLLRGLRHVLADAGAISFTTLILNNRYADRYLNMLGNIGAVVPRTADQVTAIFDEVAMPAKFQIRGNMAFIRHPPQNCRIPELRGHHT